MYVIRCVVTGDKRGTRETLLTYPRSSEIMHFDSYEAALAKATAMQLRRRQKQFATAPFFAYSVATVSVLNPVQLFCPKFDPPGPSPLPAIRVSPDRDNGA